MNKVQLKAYLSKLAWNKSLEMNCIIFTDVNASAKGGIWNVNINKIYQEKKKRSQAFHLHFHWMTKHLLQF